MATLRVVLQMKVDCINGVGCIGIGGSYSRLDAGTKWNLTMFVAVLVFSCENSVWAKVIRYPAFHREKVQLVSAHHGQVPDHQLGHCLARQSMAGGPN